MELIIDRLEDKTSGAVNSSLARQHLLIGPAERKSIQPMVQPAGPGETISRIIRRGWRVDVAPLGVKLLVQVDGLSAVTMLNIGDRRTRDSRRGTIRLALRRRCLLPGQDSDFQLLDAGSATLASGEAPVTVARRLLPDQSKSWTSDFVRTARSAGSGGIPRPERT